MPSPRAVLWDMDGTIIDSEEFHWISWRDTMAAEGKPITHEQFLASFGLRNANIIPGWVGPACTAQDIERIGDTKEIVYRQMVRSAGIAALPGVMHWLKTLHQQGWRQAIASSAPRENVVCILEALGAAQYFDGIVSAEDVTHGKPHPEVYLTAARKAGAAPDRCIVVEDALAGIKGAQRAGMKTIGINPSGKAMPADILTATLDLLPADTFDKLLG